MHRIDAPNHDNNLFTEGDPSIAKLATDVSADWLNDVQENIVTVIEDAGVSLTKGRAEDLLDAINAMIAGSVAPDATTTTKGIVELATNTETTTGTDTSRATTPAGVKAAIDARNATTTKQGMVELATNTETTTGTDSTRATTPAGVKAALDARSATTTTKGMVELATNTETINGTDSTRAVTPASLQAKLDEYIPHGTKMLFVQNAVPTGWLFYGTNNDRVLINTTGADGGATGGSWIFAGLSILQTILTDEQLAHWHYLYNADDTTVTPGPTITNTQHAAKSNKGASDAWSYDINGTVTNPTRGRSSGVSGNDDAQGRTGHGHGWSHNGAWRPAHVKVITGQKNNAQI